MGRPDRSLMRGAMSLLDCLRPEALQGPESKLNHHPNNTDMILHHPSPENPSTLSRAWIVDTESLSLARITVSRKLRLKVEALRPLDPSTPRP